MLCAVKITIPGRGRNLESAQVVLEVVDHAAYRVRVEGARLDSKNFRVLIGGGLPKHFSHFPEIWANFQKKIANSLKSSKIGITPVKTTEILRNSEKNRRKFDENLQNLPSLSKINKNFAEFCKNYAKVLKNHRNLEWCKGKM